jgi:hypothetical protein
VLYVLDAVPSGVFRILPFGAITIVIEFRYAQESDAREIRRAMMMQESGIAASGVFLLILVGPGIAAEQQFSCKGQVVQEMTNPAVQPKPIDLNVSLGDKQKMSIKAGNETLSPRITSNNKIQLKFVTKEFTGEYFHYTGDLFLIYNSGQLAKLNCTRG